MVMLRDNQPFLPFLLIPNSPLILPIKKLGLSNNVGGFLGVLKGSIQQIKSYTSGIFLLYWNHQASFYFFLGVHLTFTGNLFKKTSISETDQVNLARVLPDKPLRRINLDGSENFGLFFLSKVNSLFCIVTEGA